MVDAVIASGEAVTVKTRDTTWGRDLLAVHRQLDRVPSEDEPDPALEREELDGEELDDREALDDEDLPF